MRRDIGQRRALIWRHRFNAQEFIKDALAFIFRLCLHAFVF